MFLSQYEQLSSRPRAHVQQLGEFLGVNRTVLDNRNHISEYNYTGVVCAICSSFAIGQCYEDIYALFTFSDIYLISWSYKTCHR